MARVAPATDLISVVIPCFNQAHFLADAIESVLFQTYPHVEVVVVDDGSTDDTAAVAGRYPSVIYVRQANRGLAAARNAGLRRSSGQYLVFLDADDRLLLDALATGHAELSKRPDCAFVSGHFRFIDRDGHCQAEWPREPPPPDAYQQLLRLNYIGMIATVMFRHSTLVTIGGFRRHAPGAEDYDAYLRITRLSAVSQHDQIVAEYRRYGSAMSDNAVGMLIGTLRALRMQRRYIQRHRRLQIAYGEGVAYYRDQYLAAARESIRRAWTASDRRLWALRSLATLFWRVPAESMMIVRDLVLRPDATEG
jgi:glycosyltransferase involved in cell wall biosynthesis